MTVTLSNGCISVGKVPTRIGYGYELILVADEFRTMSSDPRNVALPRMMIDYNVTNQQQVFKDELPVTLKSGSLVFTRYPEHTMMVFGDRMVREPFTARGDEKNTRESTLLLVSMI